MQPLLGPVLHPPAPRYLSSRSIPVVAELAPVVAAVGGAASVAVAHAAPGPSAAHILGAKRLGRQRPAWRRALTFVHLAGHARSELTSTIDASRRLVCGPAARPRCTTRANLTRLTRRAEPTSTPPRQHGSFHRRPHQPQHQPVTTAALTGGRNTPLFPTAVDNVLVATGI